MTLKPSPHRGKNTSEYVEHQRLTSLINSMADAVIAVDEHAHIMLYNGATLNIFDINNIKLESSLGKLFRPVNNEGEHVDIVDMVRHTKAPTANRDLSLVYKDGSRINLYISIAPVHLGYGEGGEDGYVILLRDITREKSLEEERDEFISVVSHELRTPIAISEGSISNAQMIVEKSGDIETVQKVLREAHDQVMFLSDMINDLSTLSRAERGKLAVETEKINVHELMLELESNYQPQAAAKGLKLQTVLDPKLELLSSGKLYVREVLQNFITNSIKYTLKGGIVLQAAALEDGVRFSIQDTGIGISKSDQARVFDKFFRSGDFRTRQASGTGLGLYVTAKLARLINADISLKSELNKGSTFTIVVPNMKPSGKHNH